METRRSVIMSVVLAGIALGLAVAFGPWVSSLFVDNPAIEVEGPFNAVMLILGAIFALPAAITLAARRRFAATTVRTVVAVVVNVGVTLFVIGSVQLGIRPLIRLARRIQLRSLTRGTPNEVARDF